MDQALITVLTVNYNSSVFVGHILNILPLVTTNPYRIVIADNNSNSADIARLSKIVRHHPGATLTRRATASKGSIAHGEALNELIASVTTPYFAILDADAIWVKKGWDTLLLSQLNETTKIAGSQADGGGKPLDFPLVYGALIETATFKRLKIDMRPKNIGKLEDTGFEMREKYLRGGYLGKVLEARNTRSYKMGPFKDIVGVGEYYLNNELMLSHFGRGSNPFGKSLSPIKLPVIRHVLTYFMFMHSRAKWLRTCRVVVDRQQEVKTLH